MTFDEIRYLDGFVRAVTSSHPTLPDPWRVVVRPNEPRFVVIQVDPIEAERRGHGPLCDEVMRFGPGVTFGQAQQAVEQRLAQEARGE
jgi:hypothetical protein